jgi:3-hydroxymyristoyl/3-hydroxydecanoyl-(acyl carrier protein) dehydratase
MTLRDSIAAARISGPLRQPDGAAVFEFRFGADDRTFAGHFPARPLLPGVFQLEMARAMAEWILGCPLAVREVYKAKFMRPILPDEIVRADLRLSESGGTVQARADFSVAGQRAGETVLRLWRNA